MPESPAPNRRLAPVFAALAATVIACGPSAVPSASTAVTPSPGIVPTPSAVATVAPSVATAPAARSAASMAWDPGRQTVVMFGGAGASGPLRTLDAWDGAAWSRLADDGPSPRTDALLVADADRGVLVLHGGRSGQTPLTDTWEWDGTAWLELDAEGPPARAHAVAAFDHGLGQVVLYGGVGADDTAFEDTWTWDGATWKTVDDHGIGGHVPTGMAWDPVDERLLILAVDLDAPAEDGLYVSELWAWSGGRWERVAGGGPAFSPMQTFVEGPRHPWLVDGGAAQGTFGTWEWTGTGEEWTSITGPAPEPRNGQAVAFDATRHEMVLFGGFAGAIDFGDTWLLTDGSWREVD